MMKSLSINTKNCYNVVPIFLIDCILYFVSIISSLQILNLAIKSKDMCLPFKMPKGKRMNNVRDTDWHL